MKWASQDTSEDTIQKYCNRFADLVIKEVINCNWVPGAKEFLTANPYKQLFVVTSATPQEEGNHS